MTDVSRWACSFGAQAELYDRLRPGYPPAAVGAALLPLARRVADVGAGTGKLTAALLTRGLDVTAVEPDDAMRAVLAARLPAARVLAGTGERLPLPAGSLDAVLYGQAWHWTDPQASAREAHRVLTVGGTLAMLWNMHLDAEPWVAELNRLTGSPAVASALPGPPRLPGFASGQRTETRWEQSLRPDELVDLTRTWSSVATLPESDRERVLAEVRHLLATGPGVAGSDPVRLPYVCVTWAYTRLPDDL